MRRRRGTCPARRASRRCVSSTTGRTPNGRRLRLVEPDRWRRRHRSALAEVAGQLAFQGQRDPRRRCTVAPFEAWRSRRSRRRRLEQPRRAVRRRGRLHVRDVHVSRMERLPAALPTRMVHRHRGRGTELPRRSCLRVGTPRAPTVRWPGSVWTSSAVAVSPRATTSTSTPTVEARVELAAGSAPDEAIYIDNVRTRRRELSVLILLDVSGLGR